MRHPYLIALLALGACSSTPAARPHATDPIDGRWEGIATAFGAEAPLTIDFVCAGDSLQALVTMHMEALWMDRPLENVRYDDPRIHFEFPSRDGNGVFDGIRSGDSISGETRKNGRAVRMVFRRASRSVPEKPYRRDVVSFRSDDGADLEGTVMTPLVEGLHPAVVFIHGSGPGVREDFTYLADAFARAGFVALSYDKRGSGRSRGDLATATYHDFAWDTRAAMRALAQRRDVDASRIGIAGSSEGGWVAPIVASTRETGVAFVIAIVTAGGSYYENGVYQNLARLERFGASPEIMSRYRDLIARVSDAARRKGAIPDSMRHELNRELEQAHRESWARVADLPRRVPEGRELQRSRWTMLDFQPAEYWRQVRAPVLLVLGAKDRNVNSEQSVERITAALRAGGNTDLTVVMYPDVDHNLMTSVEGTGTFRFPAPPAGYPDTLVRWARTKSGMNAAAPR